MPYFQAKSTVFCGRGGTRTPDFYCVILEFHFPLLPIRPFRAFLFGFLQFSGVYMSIGSNISTVFFSDCNTFATPADSTCLKIQSFSKKTTVFPPDFVIGFALLYCCQMYFTALAVPRLSSAQVVARKSSDSSYRFQLSWKSRQLLHAVLGRSLCITILLY